MIMKGEEDVGKIFMMCREHKGRKEWEPALSLHTQSRTRALTPAAGDLRRSWVEIQGS